MRMTLVNVLEIGDMEPEPAIYCKKERHAVKGLSHLPSSKDWLIIRPAYKMYWNKVDTEIVGETN